MTAPSFVQLVSEALANAKQPLTVAGSITRVEETTGLYPQPPGHHPQRSDQHSPAVQAGRQAGALRLVAPPQFG